MPPRKRARGGKQATCTQELPSPRKPSHTSPHTWCNKGAVSVLLFSAVLGVFATTTYPSISGGDAGELTVAACNFGVAHPPGYPLWTLLTAAATRLGTWLMGLPPAVSAALLQCVLGALAAVCIYLSGSALLSSHPHDPCFPAVAGAWLFSLSPTVWLYSVQAEVFGLNNLLVCALALVSVWFFQRPTDTRLLLSGVLLCGLAVSNQHTTIFTVLPTALLVLLRVAKLLTPRRVLLVLLSGLTGIASYAYLPIASYFQAMDSWGDQRSWSGFMVHFLRKEYGTFQLGADHLEHDPGMLHRLGLYISFLLHEWGMAALEVDGQQLGEGTVPWVSSVAIAVVLPLVGCCWLLLRPMFEARRHGERTRAVSSWQWWSGCVFTASYLVYMVVFHWLANLSLSPLHLGVQARFWQQPNVYLAIFWSVGLGVSVRAVSRLLSVRHVRALEASVAVALCGAHLKSHWQKGNHRGRHGNHFLRYGHAALEGVERGALVIVNGDLNNNLVKYFSQCEGMRPDVRVLGMQQMTWEWFVPMQSVNYADVTFPGVRYHPFAPGGFSMRQFLDLNLPRQPVYLCGSWKEGDESHQGAYELLPSGFCSKVVPAGTSVAEHVVTLQRGWRSLPRNLTDSWDEARYSAETWERVVYFDTWTRMIFSASFIAFHTNQVLNQEPPSPDAHDLLQLASEVHDQLLTYHARMHLPGLTRQAFRDAGVVYGMHSRHKGGDAALDEKMLHAWAGFCDGPAAGGDADVCSFVSSRVNPYTGARVA